MLTAWDRVQGKSSVYIFFDTGRFYHQYSAAVLYLSVTPLNPQRSRWLDTVKIWTVTSKFSQLVQEEEEEEEEGKEEEEEKKKKKEETNKKRGRGGGGGG